MRGAPNEREPTRRTEHEFAANSRRSRGARGERPRCESSEPKAGLASACNIDVAQQRTASAPSRGGVEVWLRLTLRDAAAQRDDMLMRELWAQSEEALPKLHPGLW